MGHRTKSTHHHAWHCDRLATPANWNQGDDVIITGAVSNDDAAKIFPGYKTVKPYLRTTAQPR